MSDTVLELSLPDRTKPVDSTILWGLCAVPFIDSLVRIFADQNLHPLSMGVNFILCGVLYLVLCRVDAQTLSTNGYKTVKWTWALLLVPIYIWKRQTITGQPRTVFWVFLACLAGSVWIEQPSVNKGILVGFSVPACDSDFVAWEAQQTFPRIPTLKANHIEPILMADVTDRGFSNGVRTCRAVITGDNATDYPVRITMRLDGSTLRTWVALTN